MPLILPSNSISAVGYEVDNSLRFDSASSDYLSRTPASSGNRKTFTFSAWVKRSGLSGATDDQVIFGANTSNGSNDEDALLFNPSNNFRLVFNNQNDAHVRTNAVFRDVSAWYHLVASIDTTQATASNRVKLYVNGEQVTSLASTSYPSQNYDCKINNTVIHGVGRLDDGGGSATFIDGYMAEVVFIDGQQLDATSFGEFDENSGIWKPINVSGLTFGTNGFYLDFENSGSLGADVSGNGNNFTVNNLTSGDQATDTCTNNFATLNPLDKPGTGNLPGFAEGNLHYNKTATGSGNNSQANSTIAVNTGKWFFEIKALDSNAIIVGIDNADNPTYDSHGNSINSSDGGIAYYNNGQKIVYGTASSYGASWTTNDIIGIAINLDDNEITFYKNGSSQGAISITTTGINYRPAIMNNGYNSTSSAYMNFGNPPFSISSGNSDGNGYGNFEYSVPSGYYSLNTKNLAEYG